MLTDKLCIELKEIAKNFIPAKDVDDLVQEVFMQLLTMDSSKLQELISSGDIHRYFNRMCKLNYYSRNSKYYYTYNKINEHIIFVDNTKPTKQIQQNLYI